MFITVVEESCFKAAPNYGFMCVGRKIQSNQKRGTFCERCPQGIESCVCCKLIRSVELPIDNAAFPWIQQGFAPLIRRSARKFN